jgi:hypothetical protein
MKHITIVTILLITSCISIKFDFNSNSYSSLKEEELKRVKDFDLSVINSDFQNDSLVNIYEIDHSIIQEKILEEGKYTWIHYWRPYCSNESCININLYSNEAKKYDHLKLLLVSQTYDFPQIQGTYELKNYPLAIFVIKNNSYSEKMKEAKQQITSKLILKEVLTDDELFADDILFFGNMIVYVGDSLDFKIKKIITQ